MTRPLLIVGTAVTAATLYGVAYAYFKWLPRYDCIVLPALVTALFAALDRAPPAARGAGIASATLLFLLAFLLHLWTLGYEGRNAVFGGILPWSDSQDFYSDAQRLMFGQRFSPVSSRRPLFAALLSVLLWAFDGNLRGALVVLTLLSALAITLPALEIWRTHGWRSAAVVYLVLLFIERRFTGFIQSEHLGVPLGALGFVALWRANALRKTASAGGGHDEGVPYPQWLAWSGLFSITLGLFARVGAMFVLPSLAVWTARAFPGPGRAPRWAALLAAASAISIAVGVNQVVFDSTARGAIFSDYPAIGYGLLHGKDFTFLREKHPELDVGRHSGEAWRLLASEAWQHPGLLAGSLARAELEFFLSPQGVFSFVWTNPDEHILDDASLVHRLVAEDGLLAPLAYWRRTKGILSLINAGAMGLIGLAFVGGLLFSLTRLARRSPDGAPSLLRASTLGVLASAPFTPPWITSGVQIQAVTLSFVAAVPAVVLFASSPQPQASPSADRPWSRWPVWTVPAFAGGFLLALGLLRRWPAGTPACDAGQSSPVRIFPSTLVEVASERAFAFQPKARGDLLASFVFLRKHFADFADSLEPYVAPGTVFVAAYDVCRRQGQILVDPDRLIRSASGPWSMFEMSDLRAPGVRRVLRVETDALPSR